MPKHQQRSRKTPYTRPTVQPQSQGFFSRIKQFFWGQDRPTQLGPPQVITDEENESRVNETVDDTSENNTRITHTSAELSGFPQLFNNSVINQSLGGELNGQQDHIAPSVPDGPNQTLQRFFEEKGDGDLSNMEVVGVLSLISQAVGRNESLVDFSHLSNMTTNNTTTLDDQTPADASILRGLHVPPSPRPYLRGTPPSTQTRNRANRTNSSRSTPWTSPRPSRISARHSIAPTLGRPTPRQSQRPAQRFGAQASVQPRHTSEADVTPAATAILKALDNSQPNRVLSRDVKLSTSTPAKSEKNESPQQGQATEQVERSVLEQDEQSEHTKEIQEIKEPIQSVNTSDTVPKFDFPKPSSAGRKPSTQSTRSLQSPSKVEVTSVEASKRDSSSAIGVVRSNVSDVGYVDNGFEFSIPVASNTSRQMTPAEEEIVAQSQAEFTF